MASKSPLLEVDWHSGSTTVGTLGSLQGQGPPLYMGLTHPMGALHPNFLWFLVRIVEGKAEFHQCHDKYVWVLVTAFNAAESIREKVNRGVYSCSVCIYIYDCTYTTPIVPAFVHRQPPRLEEVEHV